MDHGLIVHIYQPSGDVFELPVGYQQGGAVGNKMKSLQVRTD